MLCENDATSLQLFRGSAFSKLVQLFQSGVFFTGEIMKSNCCLRLVRRKQLFFFIFIRL